MKVVYVDGFKIRNTLDDDFAEVHRSDGKFSTFSGRYYIPDGEIWVDHIFKQSGEVDFLIKVDEEWESYLNNPNISKKEDDPKKPTDQLKWRIWLNSRLCKKSQAPDFVKKKEVIDGVSFVYVDGAVIRRHVDCQFFYGGHDLVYSFVPKNEIWLDITSDEREIKYFLIHEKVERDLMAKGKVYDIAHRYALVADMEARINDGVGMYPGDANYQWVGLSNEEIIKNYYV